MMKKYLYSIFDKRAGMFMDLFVAVRDEVAMRDFAKACSVDGSALSDFAEDYSLRCLGWMDLESGVVDSAGGPRIICEASVFKRGVSDA